MGKLSLYLVMFILVLFHSATSYAIQPIPDKTGISGYINLGLGAASVESNFLAESAGQDLGEDNINSLDTADSESLGLLVATFELSYVTDSKTQIYIGNLFEDYLRFDLTTRAGIRHDIGSAGRLGFSILQTPIATKVWENPYATGVSRNSTDRDSSGFRISWDDIYGSGIEIRLSSKEVDIDDEFSGAGLGLTPAEINAIDRNGDINQANLRYSLKQNKSPHKLIIGLNFAEHDLDGIAMSHDNISAEINWLYISNQRPKYVSNLLIGSADYDAEHPVFSNKADSEFIALTFTAFYYGLFGLEDWVSNASLIYGTEDSDIAFFDTQVGIITFGLLHRF